MSSTTNEPIATPIQDETSGDTAAMRGTLIVIMAAVFMVAAEARVISPLLPAIASDFQTTVSRTGSLITAYAIPYGLFQLVYGPLADRFSRQRVMGVALALFALGTFVSGFAPQLLILDLLRLFTGAVAAGVIPVALAYVGDSVPYAQRQATLGRVVSMASLGGVLSAAMGGIIASVLSWRAMFIAYGLIAGLVAAWMLWMPVRRARSGDRPRRGIMSPYIDLFRLAGRRAVALYVLVFYEGAIATSTFSFLGAFLFERDHISYALIGALLTLSGVASFTTARYVGRIVLRFGEQGMILFGGMTLTVAYIIMMLRPMPIFFSLGMLMCGAGYIIAHSTLQTRATELVPSMRGTAVALFAFSLFLGGGLGTYIAGLGIEHYGYEYTIIATAIGCAIFAVVGRSMLGIVQGRKDEL